MLNHAVSLVRTAENQNRNVKHVCHVATERKRSCFHITYKIPEKDYNNSYIK